jgi:molecular chaperone HtpG
MYRNYFLTKDHSYYDDTSLLLHQTLNYFDKEYELYVVSGERFGNRVKLDWPNLFSRYNFGFNILGSGSVREIFCLLQTLQGTIILWNPYTKEVKVIPKSPLDCVSNK